MINTHANAKKLRHPSISADLLERQACETPFIAAASQQQPASCSQPVKPAKPAKPASQPSQPGQPANAASGHRSLRPPGLDVSKVFYRGIQSVVIRCHRPAQAAKPSGLHSTRGEAAKHATNPFQISMMWQPFQQIESWDVSGTTISWI